MLFDFSSFLLFIPQFLTDSFLQIMTNNATSSTLPQTFISPQALANTVQGNSEGVNGTLTLATTAIIGLVGKHLYDTKKRSEIVNVASDIDRIQMEELADNYNDFADFASNMEDWLQWIMKNPNMTMGEVLNVITDDVTKETLGVKMITACRNIQKYNQQYYKNPTFKSNSNIFKTNNPLKNVRSYVRDLSTPSPN